MLRSLKEVQGDDSIVGFYQATTLGSFYNQSLVETQAIQQEKLRHGGIVVVHGQLEFTIQSYAWYPDLARTFQTFREQREGMQHSGPSD